MSSTIATPRSGGSRLVLAVASLAAFMAFLDTTIVNIAFPALQRAFAQPRAASISWVLNSYNIVFAALLLTAGQLADRYSRRGLFMLGLGVFTLASAGCALAPSLAALIACRMLQALGAALLIPTSMALLLASFPRAEQMRAIALLAAVSGVAFAVGPSVGGLLIHTVGWRGIFLINVPIGVLALAATRRLAAGAPPPGAQSARPPDLAGALLVALGVGLLALAIVQGNTWGWGSPRILLSFVAAAALVVAACRRAARHPAPAIELDLFRARRFTVANAAVFVFGLGLAAKLLCDVLFMTSVWHYSELETGFAVTASPLVTAAVASSAARLAVRIGSGPAAGLGGALYACGCLWYVTHMSQQPHYLTAYLPGTAFTGVGIALILPTLTSTAMLAVPASRLAAGAGINSMIRQLGAVLGVALFVAIVGSPTRSQALAAFHRGWILAAAAATLAALGTVGLRARASSQRSSLRWQAQRPLARDATPGPEIPLRPPRP